MALPWGHMFYIGLYREKKNETTRPRALHDIWYVASPSRPLPSLFKLCAWGQNGPAPGSPGTWSAFNIYLYVSFKKTQVSALGPFGPLVFHVNFLSVKCVKSYFKNASLNFGVHLPTCLAFYRVTGHT